MVRILVADDHAVVRRGLIHIIRDEMPEVQIEEAQDTAELFSRLRAGQHWDAVVLDISMPGISGLDALADIKQQYPNLPVLVLSGHPEERYALRALRAGAAGYLNKESAPHNLVSALRKVLGGRRYISPALAERLAEDLATASQDRDDRLPHERLSNREFEVLCGIARGKSVGQLAEEMCLSEKTVSTYRTRLLEKMAMESNAQLMRYALDNKLVD